MFRAILCTVLLLAPLSIAACDSGGGSSGPVSGSVTLQADEGVNLTTGAVEPMGNFANSDLYATRQGSSLKLTSGGATPIENRPVNWFRTSGGIYQTFGGLGDVPDEAPTSDMTQPNVAAGTGHGFVVLTAGGTYTKGWIASASADAVIIDFAPMATAP